MDVFPAWLVVGVFKTNCSTEGFGVGVVAIGPGQESPTAIHVGRRQTREVCGTLGGRQFIIFTRGKGERQQPIVLARLHLDVVETIHHAVKDQRAQLRAAVVHRGNQDRQLPVNHITKGHGVARLVHKGEVQWKLLAKTFFNLGKFHLGNVGALDVAQVIAGANNLRLRRIHRAQQQEKNACCSPVWPPQVRRKTDHLA